MSDRDRDRPRGRARARPPDERRSRSRSGDRGERRESYVILFSIFYINRNFFT